MSKMDGLRAMREAKYAKAAATKPASKPASRPKPVTQAATGAAVPDDAETDPAPTGERLCGHRAISGRTCTREHGHEAKSHRYA